MLAQERSPRPLGLALTVAVVGSNCTNMLALSLPRQGLDISASLEGEDL